MTENNKGKLENRFLVVSKVEEVLQFYLQIIQILEEAGMKNRLFKCNISS